MIGIVSHGRDSILFSHFNVQYIKYLFYIQVWDFSNTEKLNFIFIVIC